VSVLHNRRWVVVAAVVAAATIAACGENLDGGSTCPALCPNQNIPTKDTVISPVLFDSTVVGYPAMGTEPYLVLEARDGMDSRVIVRYDSLPFYVVLSSTDSAPVTQIDSVQLQLRIDPASSIIEDTIHLEAFDVDTTAPDSSVGAVLALFRPDRLIGAVDLLPGGLPDSILIPLSDSVVLSKIQGRAHLRVGYRISSAGRAQLRLFSLESGTSLVPTLSYDPSPDTITHVRVFYPLSHTPVGQAQLAADLADYTVVVSGSPATPADQIGVGGFPGRRAFLAFRIPQEILDSGTIVRATLTLVQAPNTTLDATDSIVIWPQLVRASKGVSVARAANLLAPPITYDLDSMRVSPADSGERTLKMVQLLRAWKAQNDTTQPRAIVLRSSVEGTLPSELRFYSSEAPLAVRPQLRISYIPRVNFGLP
jgi:hypothetical protein